MFLLLVLHQNGFFSTFLKMGIYNIKLFHEKKKKFFLVM